MLQYVALGLMGSRILRTRLLYALMPFCRSIDLSLWLRFGTYHDDHIITKHLLQLFHCIHTHINQNKILRKARAIILVLNLQSHIQNKRILNLKFWQFSFWILNIKYQYPYSQAFRDWIDISLRWLGSKYTKNPYLDHWWPIYPTRMCITRTIWVYIVLS